MVMTCNDCRRCNGCAKPQVPLQRAAPDKVLLLTEKLQVVLRSTPGEVQSSRCTPGEVEFYRCIPGKVQLSRCAPGEVHLSRYTL